VRWEPINSYTLLLLSHTSMHFLRPGACNKHCTSPKFAGYRKISVILQRITMVQTFNSLSSIKLINSSEGQHAVMLVYEKRDKIKKITARPTKWSFMLCNLLHEGNCTNSDKHVHRLRITDNTTSSSHLYSNYTSNYHTHSCTFFLSFLTIYKICQEM